MGLQRYATVVRFGYEPGDFCGITASNGAYLAAQILAEQVARFGLGQP